ncbi:ATP synthase F1 subunit delta [Patescibacteria group bacterium]|nr:ATP synthase F1 subunit delta [Patescibacteria group bacterium]
MKGKDQAKILAKGVYTAIKDKDKKQSDLIISNFSKYIAQYRLEKIIPSILEELQNLYFAEEGIVSANIYSKEKLDEKQVKAICKIIEDKTEKKVVSQEEIDNNLIGGVLIKYEDKVIDISIKNNLNKLAKQLTN